MAAHVIVFCGPSLGRRDVERFGFEWRPPVRQGDLYRAARQGPRVIGVVDGFFEVTPTVWHKEILWALAKGIHVYGAASMGALRAVELESFGMRGVGAIYQAFRSGALVDDDEVAVMHGPCELDFIAVAEPMVNIRATLIEAARRGAITRPCADQLEAIAKSLFYKERSF